MEAKFIILFLAVLFWQCQSPKNERTIQAVKSDATSISNADIIKNPVTADQPVDTVNVAKMDFRSRYFDYGEAIEGEIIEHTFKFTNTGKAPLIISNAKSTCGCTVPEWPKEPIPVGESGAIKVKFNTDKKLNIQVKPVFITANTHPSETRLQMTGKVIKKNQK